MFKRLRWAGEGDNHDAFRWRLDGARDISIPDGLMDCLILVSPLCSGSPPARGSKAKGRAVARREGTIE